MFILYYIGFHFVFVFVRKFICWYVSLETHSSYNNFVFYVISLTLEMDLFFYIHFHDNLFCQQLKVSFCTCMGMVTMSEILITTCSVLHSGNIGVLWVYKTFIGVYIFYVRTFHNLYVHTFQNFYVRNFHIFYVHTFYIFYVILSIIFMYILFIIFCIIKYKRFFLVVDSIMLKIN